MSSAEFWHGMSLAQVCALIDEEASMKRHASRAQTRGHERSATLADAAMLARLGLNPPPG